MLGGMAVDRFAGVGPVLDSCQKPVVVADLFVGGEVAVGPIPSPGLQCIEEVPTGRALVPTDCAINVMQLPYKDCAPLDHTSDFSNR